MVSFLLTGAVTTRSFAQTEPSAREVKTTLPGLWQHVFPDGKFSNQLKFIGADGTWQNIWFLPQNGQAIVYMQGTYKISPDGLYTETIENSTLPEHNGQSTDITVQIFSKDKINMNYLWGDKSLSEDWVRVTLPILPNQGKEHPGRHHDKN
jgi:hypothetical protein